MLNDLGNFADIVQINTLSMVAEDYKSSTSSSFKIYKVIRTHLLKKIRLLLVNYRWCMSWIRYWKMPRVNLWPWWKPMLRIGYLLCMECWIQMEGQSWRGFGIHGGSLGFLGSRVGRRWDFVLGGRKSRKWRSCRARVLMVLGVWVVFVKGWVVIVILLHAFKKMI